MQQVKLSIMTGFYLEVNLAASDRSQKKVKLPPSAKTVACKKTNVVHLYTQEQEDLNSLLMTIVNGIDEQCLLVRLCLVPLLQLQLEVITAAHLYLPRPSKCAVYRSAHMWASGAVSQACLRSED